MEEKDPKSRCFPTNWSTKPWFRGNTVPPLHYDVDKDTVSYLPQNFKVEKSICNYSNQEEMTAVWETEKNKLQVELPDDTFEIEINIKTFNSNMGMHLSQAFQAADFNKDLKSNFNIRSNKRGIQKEKDAAIEERKNAWIWAASHNPSLFFSPRMKWYYTPNTRSLREIEKRKKQRRMLQLPMTPEERLKKKENADLAEVRNIIGENPFPEQPVEDCAQQIGLYSEPFNPSTWGLQRIEDRNEELLKKIAHEESTVEEEAQLRTIRRQFPTLGSGLGWIHDFQQRNSEIFHPVSARKRAKAHRKLKEDREDNIEEKHWTKPPLAQERNIKKYIKTYMEQEQEAKMLSKMEDELRGRATLHKENHSEQDHNMWKIEVYPYIREREIKKIKQLFHNFPNAARWLHIADETWKIEEEQDICNMKRAEETEDDPRDIPATLSPTPEWEIRHHIHEQEEEREKKHIIKMLTPCKIMEARERRLETAASREDQAAMEEDKIREIFRRNPKTAQESLLQDLLDTFIWTAEAEPMPGLKDVTLLDGVSDVMTEDEYTNFFTTKKKEANLEEGMCEYLKNHSKILHQITYNIAQYSIRAAIAFNKDIVPSILDNRRREFETGKTAHTEIYRAYYAFWKLKEEVEKRRKDPEGDYNKLTSRAEVEQPMKREQGMITTTREEQEQSLPIKKRTLKRRKAEQEEENQNQPPQKKKREQEEDQTPISFQEVEITTTEQEEDTSGPPTTGSTHPKGDKAVNRLHNMMSQLKPPTTAEKEQTQDDCNHMEQQLAEVHIYGDREIEVNFTNSDKVYILQPPSSPGDDSETEGYEEGEEEQGHHYEQPTATDTRREIQTTPPQLPPRNTEDIAVTLERIGARYPVPDTTTTHATGTVDKILRKIEAIYKFNPSERLYTLMPSTTERLLDYYCTLIIERRNPTEKWAIQQTFPALTKTLKAKKAVMKRARMENAQRSLRKMRQLSRQRKGTYPPADEKRLHEDATYIIKQDPSTKRNFLRTGDRKLTQKMESHMQRIRNNAQLLAGKCIDITRKVNKEFSKKTPDLGIIKDLSHEWVEEKSTYIQEMKKLTANSSTVANTYNCLLLQQAELMQHATELREKIKQTQQLADKTRKEDKDMTGWVRLENKLECIKATLDATDIVINRYQETFRELLNHLAGFRNKRNIKDRVHIMSHTDVDAWDVVENGGVICPTAEDAEMYTIKEFIYSNKQYNQEPWLTSDGEDTDFEAEVEEIVPIGIPPAKTTEIPRPANSQDNKPLPNIEGQFKEEWKNLWSLNLLAEFCRQYQGDNINEEILTYCKKIQTELDSHNTPDYIKHRLDYSTRYQTLRSTIDRNTETITQLPRDGELGWTTVKVHGLDNEGRKPIGHPYMLYPHHTSNCEEEQDGVYAENYKRCNRKQRKEHLEEARCPSCRTPNFKCSLCEQTHSLITAAEVMNSTTSVTCLRCKNWQIGAIDCLLDTRKKILNKVIEDYDSQKPEEWMMYDMVPLNCIYKTRRALEIDINTISTISKTWTQDMREQLKKKQLVNKILKAAEKDPHFCNDSFYIGGISSLPPQCTSFRCQHLLRALRRHQNLTIQDLATVGANTHMGILGTRDSQHEYKRRFHNYMTKHNITIEDYKQLLL